MKKSHEHAYLLTNLRHLKTNLTSFFSLYVLTLCIAAQPVHAAEVLVETESFTEMGGWKHDPQFIDQMGSPYLLAHGLGEPVEDAHTTVTFPKTGTYYMWVRTKDWIPEPEWAPGIFKVTIDGKPSDTNFGTEGDGSWIWQSGGEVTITKTSTTIGLKDLTGFNGRCDALLFSTDKNYIPPSKAGPQMRTWRKKLLGLPNNPPLAGTFDVVVIGGGISGCSAALTAARLGCKVAMSSIA